ncbi:MAG TPA: thioredoxin [Gammaproteobacteria bacterium]|nr:thioredoxin [Gammaproteobacteria bacterium]
MLIRIVLACLFFIPAQAIALPSLEPARDLAADAAKAACSGQPLVLMFSSDYCTYCHIVRELYLRPILEDKRYPGIIIREINTTSSDQVRDFNGRTVTMQDLAFQYDTHLVPVVAMLGTDGEMLTEPMIGISSQDYYGYYLDEALQSAGEQVRRQSSDAPSGVRREYACD